MKKTPSEKRFYKAITNLVTKHSGKIEFRKVDRNSYNYYYDTCVYIGTYNIKNKHNNIFKIEFVERDDITIYLFLNKKIIETKNFSIIQRWKIKRKLLSIYKEHLKSTKENTFKELLEQYSDE